MLKSKTFRTSNNQWTFFDAEINKWLAENPRIEVKSNTITAAPSERNGAYVYVNIIYRENVTSSQLNS